MEKKIWTKPEISVVEFEANEYVAACASRTSYTHSYDSTGYSLFLEATGNSEFDYVPSGTNTDGQSMLASDAYIESVGGEIGNGYKYGEEAYFTYMQDYIKDHTNLTSDQVLRFPEQDGTQVFTGCGNSTISPPSNTFAGWFYSISEDKFLGKAQIWWDNTTARIHAALGVSSHSA